MCIKNHTEIHLTIGKIYKCDELDDESLTYYLVCNDGYYHFQPKSWFRLVSEIREEKINKILNDSCLY